MRQSTQTNAHKIGREWADRNSEKIKKEELKTKWSSRLLVMMEKGEFPETYTLDGAWEISRVSLGTDMPYQLRVIADGEKTVNLFEALGWLFSVPVPEQDPEVRHG